MSCILSRTLPLNPQETPTSYCSRLAARNLCSSAQEFCLDMGFTLAGLVEGNDKALVGLATVSGVDVDVLRDRSFTKVGPRLFQVCGQVIIAAASRRNYLRFCPVCLMADLSTQVDYGKAAAFQRVHWQISWFRSCPVHSIGLVSQGKLGKAMACADFAGITGPSLPQLQEEARLARIQPPTAMERYLFNRLYGLEAAARPWLLDTLPMYLAVRLCELIGAISVHGAKVSVRNLDEDAVAHAAHVGCDILVGGEGSFRHFVRQSMSVFWDKGGDAGGMSLFGGLYGWLHEQIEEQAFDPFREAIRSEMLAALPLGPADTIFNQPAGRRRIWSLAAVASHLGVTDSRMRRYFEMQGLLHDENKALRNERIVFPADLVEPLLEQFQSLMGPKEAAKRLRITRARVQDLMDHGLLVPFIKSGDETLFRTAFKAVDVDEFMEKVERQVTMDMEPGMTSISAAAKLSPLAYPRVVRLLLEGRLTRVAKMIEADGDLPVAVDPAEIRRLRADMENQGEPWPYLTIDDVAERMKWKSAIVRSLVAEGLLVHREMLNPATKRRCIVVHRDDLECFDKEYVTLGDATQKFGYGYILENFLRQGVKPSISVNNGSQVFYYRAELGMV